MNLDFPHDDVGECARGFSCSILRVLSYGLPMLLPSRSMARSARSVPGRPPRWVKDSAPHVSLSFSNVFKEAQELSVAPFCRAIFHFSESQLPFSPFSRLDRKYSSRNRSPVLHPPKGPLHQCSFCWPKKAQFKKRLFPGWFPFLPHTDRKC